MSAGSADEKTDGKKSGISRRGFASMDLSEVKKLAGQGGRKAHQMKKGHEFSRAEAIEAGRKGGIASAARRKAEREAEAAATK